MATITFTITVANPGSGNKFYIDGSAGAAITFHYGVTYKFDQSDSSNAGHPLRFATAADAAGSTEYTTGVTNAGTPGSGGAYTQIASISSTTTTPLYYYCTNHSGMGGTITVATTDNYKNIQGYSVQSLSSDPSASTSVGQVWYNSTSYTFKIANQGAGAWAAGGAMNTGRFPLGSATNAPAHSTALGFGGTGPSGKTGATESYDGTTWTEKGDLVDARIALGGAGTATAALAFGGDSPGYPTATESWNGTSWTVVPATLTEGKDSAAGFGLQTAAIYAAGYVGPPGNTTNVGSYNGTAWTEVNNINTARSYVYGCGIQTSGIIAGGSGPPYTAVAETWNGTSWTEVADLNTARANFAMFGTQTTAVGSGGDDGSTPRFTKTEKYDGTSWTEVGDLANANKMSASSGTAGTTGLNFGGSSPTNAPMTRTEAWSDPVYSIKTVTVS